MRYTRILFSPTGGTAAVAGLLSAPWGAAADTVDLCDRSADFAACTFSAADVVLIAVPSYAGRVPAVAASRLYRLQGGGAQAVLLCVYGNRAYEDTLAELEDLAVGCGFRVVAAVAGVAEHSILHQYATGRPDGADAAALHAFGEKIRKKLTDGQDTPPAIPGNRPYRPAGASRIKPAPGPGCMQCGLCARQCPTGAIDPDDCSAVDAARCISCMRCVAVCPQQARSGDRTRMDAVAQAIQSACAVHKPCELYI